MQDVKLYSSADTCQRLGISRSTLSQWLLKRWITPAEQFGNGAYVFTSDEIDRAAREQAARAERGQRITELREALRQAQEAAS